MSMSYNSPIILHVWLDIDKLWCRRGISVNGQTSDNEAR
jgi:hypothetical protein